MSDVEEDGLLQADGFEKALIGVADQCGGFKELITLKVRVVLLEQQYELMELPGAYLQFFVDQSFAEHCVVSIVHSLFLS